MQSPVYIERDSVETVCFDFLEDVRPKVWISGQPPRVEFCGQDVNALSMDEEGVRVPGDCVSESCGVSPR